jgi:hypothetical protein
MYEPERREFGWEAAQLGMMYFLLIGVVKIWVFPMVATFGPMLGLFLRGRAKSTREATIISPE